MLDTLDKQTNIKMLSVADLAALTDIRLPQDLPVGFEEAQVIHRTLRSDNGKATFDRIDEPTPVVKNAAYTTIEAFVRDVALNGYTRTRDDEPEATLLGIRVTYPSYIVLEIHEQTDWTFSATSPAVQFKDAVQFPELYGYLRYVRPDGTISAQPVAGCKIVFFAAMPAFGNDQNYYIQKLNYYVTDGGNTGQIIDPDIRHPGVGNS